MERIPEENFILKESEENRQLLQKYDKCDKYDYLLAAAYGAVGGLIDIFFVGMPGGSVLGNWTDAQVDHVVKGFAKVSGWNPSSGKQGNVASAILNQFTSTSSFIANGKIITIKTDTYELQGNNFIAKVFCGIANWFGHIMSDISGSSGGRGNAGRGSGVVIPFFELFQFCRFGKFSVGKDRQDLATIAVRAFQEGYDFRFGMAMAIPVVVTDLAIRLIWALRRRFQYDWPVKECIPTQKHADLRVMLILGNGTLCVMDGIDAGIRSGGNFLTFFMHLNLIAWFRFVMLVLKEVCIRVGLVNGLQMQIEAYKRINAALQAYLCELEKIDIETFRKETQMYNRLAAMFASADSEEGLNALLLEAYEDAGISKPWKGDFSEHMSDKNGTMVFE